MFIPKMDINWKEIPNDCYKIDVYFCNKEGEPLDHNRYERPNDNRILRCTAIMHCDNLNYQSDFCNTKDTVIEVFVAECKMRKVVWAKLFTEQGDCICEYN